MAMQLQTRGPMSEINVTPLVDVMLVLLIIFMVTAPLLQAGVEIDLPEAKAPVLDSEDPTLDMLTVETFGLARFNDAEIRFSTLADLRAALGDKIANRPKLPGKPEDVFIRANRDLPYGYIVGIMALLQEMGVEKLGLVTEMPEGGAEPATPGGVVPEGPPDGSPPPPIGPRSAGERIRIPPGSGASPGSSQ